MVHSKGMTTFCPISDRLLQHLKTGLAIATKVLIICRRVTQLKKLMMILK